MSEPLRQNSDPRVIDWIDAQPLETLFLFSITVAELRMGVELLQPGRRRTTLRDSLERRVIPLFTGRVLALDLPCTAACARLMGAARKAGLAIGAANGLMVTSRDVKPHESAGIEVINPWKP